jgi:hypothetical protein
MEQEQHACVALARRVGLEHRQCHVCVCVCHTPERSDPQHTCHILSQVVGVQLNAATHQHRQAAGEHVQTAAVKKEGCERCC